MTLPRDYTLAEIDAMREMTRERIAMQRGCSTGDLQIATVEDCLRTYMMAGVTLAELRGVVVKEADPFEGE